MASLLALSDVMGTGHHAAVSAGVRPGSVVAVVGDGAVGLSAVIAVHPLGAERIITLSRYPARQELARSFGATNVLAERGDAATKAVRELTDGVDVDAALECVGTAQAMATALLHQQKSGHGRWRPVCCSDGSGEFGEDCWESVVRVEVDG